jgi:hypothetical protein
MNTRCINCYLLGFSMVLLLATAEAEQPKVPAPPSPKTPMSTARQQSPIPPDPSARPPGRQSPSLSEPVPAPSSRSPKSPSGSGTVTVPSPGASLGNGPMTPMVTPSAGAPLAYSTTRNETALRIEDLMRGAAALRTQGDFSKAMELYNEALTIAPEYAEGYRQRAFTLVRLGDRVQAQVDYNRFLALDPQSPDQVREEVTLF